MANWIFETYGVQIVQAVLCAIGGGLGYAVWKLYNRYIDTAEKRSVAYTAAAFVEQVWTDIHGPEKLAKALEAAEALLKKKGIAFDKAEMEILIEAAVGAYINSFRKPLNDEASADATRRIESDDSDLAENCLPD